MLSYLRLAGALSGLALVLYIGHSLYSAGARAEAAEAEVQRLEQVERDAIEYRSAQAEIAKLAQKHVQRDVKVRTITKEIIREIRDSNALAGDPPLSPAWRLRHDRAATGSASKGGPSSGPDGAPASAQDAAETVADNYGTYHALAEQLRGLQEYVQRHCAPPAEAVSP